MCQFKSGIILKNKIVIAHGADDSHSNLLDELNIEDNTENAMRRFVRAELVPPNNEWWTDPDTWKINIDQDITPEWFDIDREKYEEDFRIAVKEWWKIHVLIDQKVEELSSGYYRLKRCEVKKLLKDVVTLLDNSTVQRMLDNSTVQRMYCNSTVQEMYCNSTVQRMCENSTVQRMCENSTVQRMWGNSTVQRMLDNSTVQRMYCNSIAIDNHSGVIRISKDSDLKEVRNINEEKISNECI